MTNDMTRLLVETIVKKYLNDILDSPERSIRNLVDMALQFSEGRFQQRFFTVAQTMLTRPDSMYYPMIHDIVQHVDHQRLLTFGMNLGYNSCTEGARRIRIIEAAQHFNVPWTIALQMDDRSYADNRDAYHYLINQGEQIGIHTWQIFAADGFRELLSFAAWHPDSAFIYYCSPNDITESFLDYAQGLNNLMVVVRYEVGVEEVCTQMRQLGLLYSVYYPYSANDLEWLTDDELLICTEQLHAFFTVLVPSPDCPIEIRKSVYQYVESVRSRQLFRTVPWEADYDSRRIDGIISEDNCSVLFDSDGWMHTALNDSENKNLNIFEKHISVILKQAFPKSSKK